MATSNLEFSQIKFIVEHFESILNEAIIKNNKQVKENMAAYREKIRVSKEKFFSKPQEQFDRIGRFKPKYMKEQQYFQFMIFNQNYIYFNEIDEKVENFLIFLKDRSPQNIFFITSNCLSLVIAMHLGLCGIPIT